MQNSEFEHNLFESKLLPVRMCPNTFHVSDFSIRTQLGSNKKVLNLKFEHNLFKSNGLRCVNVQTHLTRRTFPFEHNWVRTKIVSAGDLLLPDVIWHFSPS